MKRQFSCTPVQAEQALVPDQPREFIVNFQDRRSGEMRLSIRVSMHSYEGAV